MRFIIITKDKKLIIARQNNCVVVNSIGIGIYLCLVKRKLDGAVDILIVNIVRQSLKKLLSFKRGVGTCAYA